MTSLFVPLHTEKLIPNVTTSECHGTRHVCARGKSHEEQESRSLTSPLQMHAKIQNVDLEAARWSFMKSDAPARAIILGSIVSLAWLGRAHSTEDSPCPWCGRVGNLMHIAWHCSQLPNIKDRPPKPTSWFLSQFAWPQINTPANVHKQVLQWFASVQILFLFLCYGPCWSHNPLRERHAEVLYTSQGLQHGWFIYIYIQESIYEGRMIQPANAVI